MAGMEQFYTTTSYVDYAPLKYRKLQLVYTWNRIKANQGRNERFFKTFSDVLISIHKVQKENVRLRMTWY